MPVLYYVNYNVFTPTILWTRVRVNLCFICGSVPELKRHLHKKCILYNVTNLNLLLALISDSKLVCINFFPFDKLCVLSMQCKVPR